MARNAWIISLFLVSPGVNARRQERTGVTLTPVAPTEATKDVQQEVRGTDSLGKGRLVRVDLTPASNPHCAERLDGQGLCRRYGCALRSARLQRKAETRAQRAAGGQGHSERRKFRLAAEGGAAATLRLQLVFCGFERYMSRASGEEIQCWKHRGARTGQKRCNSHREH